jgi:hypothetical protein
MLAPQWNRVTGSRVTALPRLTIVQGKTAKTPNLDSLTRGQRLRHMINQQLNRQLHIFGAQLALTFGHQINQFTTRHRYAPTVLWDILADTSFIGKSFILKCFLRPIAKHQQDKKKAGAGPASVVLVGALLVVHLSLDQIPDSAR